MCGIIGIFNNQNAFSQIKQGLKILQNRGRDSIGIASDKHIQHTKQLSQQKKINSPHLMGHTLHAIIDHVPQPLRKEGLLITNCEIYNWEILNKKYNAKTKNDAQFLLWLLDNYQTKKLDELDGVYAFAYWKNNNLTITRDILGEKPLWFSTFPNFAFVSEKKVLEELSYQNIEELNPRQILTYNIAKRSFSLAHKPFFTYLPEHKDSYEKIKETTTILLNRAIEKRLPKKKCGLLFSGGIDSTYLAHYFKQHYHSVTCYTAVLDSDTIPPSDLIAAQKIAKQLKLKLKIKKVRITQIPQYLKKIVPLIEDSSVTKVGVALTFYLACEMAKKDGCKVIFSGLGSEEIFAGYERHKQSTNINLECVSGLIKLYERDLYRDDVLTMDNHLELRLPFLDKDLITYALKIPTKYKINQEQTKLIFREIAQDQGIPPEFAFRKKIAAQYGSRVDNAIERLARKNRFNSKSAYLKQFYPLPNLKLGVLFSSGKDSAAAAYIMKQQNYELTCLITLKSKNHDSYMFQTAGTEMVQLQAQAMELPLVMQETLGEKEDELEDLEKALQRAKEKYNIRGVVSGALFSTYQRDRIEYICDKLGLKIFAPLWHKQPDAHMEELLHAGFEIIFTGIAADGLDKTWLNHIITGEDIAKLKKVREKTYLNIAGEGGEFESVVLDCPLFKKKIMIISSEITTDSAHSGRLIINNARLVEK